MWVCEIIVYCVHETILVPIYSVSQKTGPLRLIWHNFTNSQRLLIIFGSDRPYSILSELC